MPARAGLHLFTSNRLEILAGKLADRLRAPLASPLAAERVVVRNQGMERWLRLELARRLGVCAHHQFEFPEEFIRHLFRQVLPDAPADSHLDRDVLAWRIAQALPELQSRPEFTPVRRYLADADERKLLQLAGRLAHLLDQYQVFRPEMVLEWDAGRQPVRDPAADWQAALWRAVTADARDRHPAALARRFAETLAGNGPIAGLPERVALFGVSALPPFHLDVLAALAGRVEVNFFLLQPSQEYWGDITSPREADRIRRRTLAGNEAAFDLHLDSGNRLLASLGYLGRDFLKLLLGAGDWQPDEDFADPGEDSLLHRLQSDLLHLRDRGAEGQADRATVAADDDSIRIHSCHSPLREMEVLQDHILDWLQREPGLEPRDIVVMMPDVETYAPFVQAVFGSTEDESRRLPFSLADRGARRESHMVETFLQLLALPETRLGAAAVLAPLDTAAVRERFGFTEADTGLLRDWVRELNIRWGMDAAHRAKLGLPGLDANTWRAGLDRLLLGHAMVSGGERLFDGILPFDDVEGDAAALAGRLADYVEQVFELVRELGATRPLAEWVTLLERMLAAFFAAGEPVEEEFQLLRDTLDTLRGQAAEAGYGAPLGLAALRERLEPALGEDWQHGGFITGGITFCGLKPMRSIPFQVVCLVGMNDGAFPRPTRHLGFDLMARTPRLGDRSTREDDRYLFLETLLSARRRLHLSYVGQDIRDNREAPPSVLVSELLDCLEQGFELAEAPGGANGARSLREHLVVRHPLQAFHPGYFDRRDPRWFSYSAENNQASRSAAEPRPAPPVFLEQPLGEPDPAARNVSLEALSRFLHNPARAFLRQRLNIAFPETAEELSEREPFVLDGREQFQLKQQLVTLAAAAPARALAAAAGTLPLGAVGQADFARAEARAAVFAQRLAGLRLPPAPPVDLAFSLDPFQVTGRLAEFTANGPLFFRCAKLKARDLLNAWVHHLAANCVTAGQVTTLLVEGGRSRLAPPDDPAGLLQALLAFYWEGLRAPLKFFPESALAFATAEQEGKAAPLEKARLAWVGNDFQNVRGEQEDAAFDCCFRGTDPLGDEFAAHARAVFGPLLAHEERTED